MTKQTTTHTTAEGKILFLAAAKAFKNKRSEKEEYSIKIELDSNDAAVAHLAEIASYKVETKTNRALEGTGKTVINFTSSFAPMVIGADGAELKGKEIPFFDSRKDEGTAVVSYKVIDFGDNKIVRLSGIKLKELKLAPREAQGESIDVTLETLRNL